MPKNMFDQITAAVTVAQAWLPVAVGVLVVILLWLIIRNAVKTRARIRQYEAEEASRRAGNLPQRRSSLFD